MPAKKTLSFYEIVEFEGLGKCGGSPNGKHQLRMTGFPNPEYWGERINESTFEFRCEVCRQHFSIPFAKVNRE